MISIDKEKDENQPLNKKARSLADIAKWGKITAVFLIITGSLSALSAIVTLLGAIPGVLLIISGVMLMRSAKAASPFRKAWKKTRKKICSNITHPLSKCSFFTLYPVWHWALSLLF